MMVKYSIIIPIYQCEKYLEKCVDSILKQNNSEFEVLLIDDGSDDGSEKIADELAEKYSNVRTIHKKNGGASSARNVGIENAHGKYLLFIDADDTIEETALWEIDNIIQKKQVDLLIYGVDFDYYDGNILQRTEHLSIKNCGMYTSGQIVKEFKSFFEDNALSGAFNKVFLKKIITENDILFNENMSFYEDFDFVVRYLQYSTGVFCMNETFYHYRNEVEGKRFKNRVENIQKVNSNMDILLTDLWNLKKKYDDDIIQEEISCVAENLFMSLLQANIRFNHYSVKKMKEKLPAYCSNEMFRKFLNNDNLLNDENKGLLDKIGKGQFKKIYFLRKKKTAVSFIRRNVKRILIKLRIYKVGCV